MTDNTPPESDPRPHSNPSQRIEAPAYLARYQKRQSGELSSQSSGTNGAVAPTEAEIDHSVPAYLRTYRARQDAQTSPAPDNTAKVSWESASLEMQQTLSEDNRNKEISAPLEAAREITNDVYFIRHGETQGYSTESGLTPLGSSQAYNWGFTLAKRVKDGETVVVRSAKTNRAGQTASQVHRGLEVGLETFGKSITVIEPKGMDEFRNFQFATPDGLRDVTSAFRMYFSQLEEIERTVSGDRPLWLVEMDRFWRIQQGGGDPIQQWLSIPMIHFEPPPMVVRRFWAGIDALAQEYPGARLAIATHSGPIRAFAVTALGYDPGEPYNAEHVRVKVMANKSGEGRKSALVTYRNRVQEIQVPNVGNLPPWSIEPEWRPSGQL